MAVHTVSRTVQYSCAYNPAGTATVHNAQCRCVYYHAGSMNFIQRSMQCGAVQCSAATNTTLQGGWQCIQCPKPCSAVCLQPCKEGNSAYSVVCNATECTTMQGARILYSTVCSAVQRHVPCCAVVLTTLQGGQQCIQRSTQCSAE